MPGKLDFNKKVIPQEWLGRYDRMISRYRDKNERQFRIITFQKDKILRQEETIKMLRRRVQDLNGELLALKATTSTEAFGPDHARH